ncbi:transposase [Streptomyces lunaelactis]|uniref:transposase n=1 Tax=Streptomyces lunaelactis TaxID=1535768 RepID=UPI00281609E8|nr:transposase [Streptomyces lunaelactis]
MLTRTGSPPAADAVRTRIDWKYALGLELDDPGFDYSVLCEFRARLAEDGAADRLLEAMLQRLGEAGLLKSRGRQRTDATHVLAAVRFLSRLELVGETLRAALEELAEAAPDWLRPLIEPEWGKRYGRRVEIGRLPGGKAAVTERAERTGRDGQTILAAAWATSAPPTCGCCRRWRSSAKCGSTTTTGTRTDACAGGTATPCPQLTCASTPPTTPMRTTASNGTPPGAATASI